jgi:hypothetical protein
VIFGPAYVDNRPRLCENSRNFDAAGTALHIRQWEGLNQDYSHHLAYGLFVSSTGITTGIFDFEFSHSLGQKQTDATQKETRSKAGS